MTTPFDETTEKKRRRTPFSGLRNSFLTGLVVIAPIGVTLWLIWTVVGFVDSVVWPFVPDRFQPGPLLNRWLGLEGEDQITVNVRGVGVIVFLIFTILVGWIAKGLIGRSLITWAENLVLGLPVVRSIYSGIKQIAETVFSQTDRSFEQAVLVEYPRPGLWAIGFVSTTTKGEIDANIPTDEEKVAIFVPTTPNPTSGFLLFVKRSELKTLEMSVEDAAKLVISAGLVYPDHIESAETRQRAAAE